MAEETRGPYRAPRSMNWGAVALSGLAAAIVILGAAYVAGLMGQEQMEVAGWLASATASALPKSPDPPPAIRELLFSIGSGIFLGFLIAWLYAAVRPRFGPGAATAFRVGAFFWFVIQGLGLFIFLAAGAPILATDVVTRVFFLVAYVVASLVAGLTYWETPESRHRRESGRWPTSS